LFLKPIVKDLATLINDKFGRRPILYLLAGRSQKYFIPQMVKYLQENDAIRALTSKKDPKVRRDELIKVLLPELTALVNKQGRKFLKQSFSSEVVCELLLHGESAITFFCFFFSVCLVAENTYCLSLS